MYNSTHTDDYSLFKILVGTLVKKRCENNIYTTNQYANLVFGKGDGGNMALVSRVTRAYQNYFEPHGAYKKRLLINAVLRDHPDILKPKGGSGRDENFINEFIKALKEEIVAIKQLNRPIKIDNLVNIRKIEHKFIYSADVNLNSDEDLILNEGALIKLNPAGIGGAVLSFDAINNMLYFECDSKLNTSMYYLMIVDTTTIINPLIDTLETYNRDGLNNLAKTVWDKKSYPNKVHEPRQVYYSDLDPSQKNAAEKALNSDVSFIWGPPGTGKSHCLSVILDELLRRDEKTLVVSIANVAVDQLLAKTLNLQDKQSPMRSTHLIYDGKILRIGYITEEPLVKRFDEAPAHKHILSLYKKMRDLQQRIHNTHSQSVKAELTAEKRALSREVNEIQKARIEKGKLVFSTATKAIMDTTISFTDFDNLVIDEASMMSIPYLFGLLKRISKRVIIAGDFTQLSPVCVSQTQLADKYLKKDLFSLAGINKHNKNHPSLSALTINRRATHEICNLYNHAFYGGIMQASRTGGKSNNVGIYYVPTDSYGAEFTNSKSRRNTNSFRIVTEFVLRHLRQSNTTIGLISPYRAQVNDYKKFFKEKGLAKEIVGRLKIGTVHTFQGSEADTIIFDTVDTTEIGVGRLFHDEAGERLINVAVSRAKDALILFGNLETFYKSNQVSFRVLKVLNIIKSKQVPIDTL